MKQKIMVPSAKPIYLMAWPWLIGCLLFKAHSLISYFFMIALSLITYYKGKTFFPDKEIEVEIAEPVPKDEELAKLMKTRDESISKMQQINAKLPDPTITEQINHIADVSKKIFNYVLEHPEKKPQISYFLNYYLPTCIKLLESYERFEEYGVSGSNIDQSKEKILHMLSTCVTAFDKQLDGLLVGEALDISSDITVMESMMRQEGLN